MTSVYEISIILHAVQQLKCLYTLMSIIDIRVNFVRNVLVIINYNVEALSKGRIFEVKNACKDFKCLHECNVSIFIEHIPCFFRDC
jgi:hypothetical protein